MAGERERQSLEPLLATPGSRSAIVSGKIAAACVVGFVTFLSAAAKSMKEAQSHMTWLMLLPMMPGYALVAYPLKSELWQYAVPFLSQNQMLLKVIRHETITPAVWAIYLGASLGLAAVLWFAAVRRYHNERLAISG